MVRLAVPSMKARGGGAIVVSTSSAVKEPMPNLALSNIVRSSSAALSKTLANELAADNIRVNHLLPGRIDTDRVRELDTIRGKASGASRRRRRRPRTSKTIPLGRYGEPEEFANAAVFLFSDAARYITGASLQVDGGMIRTCILSDSAWNAPVELERPMQVHLVNPSDVSFGIAVITPRWLFVLAAATPATLGDPILVDETLETFDPSTDPARRRRRHRHPHRQRAARLRSRPRSRARPARP